MKIKGNPRCSRCLLHQTTSNVCVMGASPGPHPHAMVIGEAPGANEERQGVAFTGESGQLLRQTLKTYGLENVYITNAVQCRPPDNKTPKITEIRACQKWVLREIDAIKPQFILLLGNVPCVSLLGLKGITELRGKPVKRDGITYFPAFHPAYILRNPDMKPIFVNDIRMFADIVYNRDTETQCIRPIIVQTAKDFERAIRAIQKSEWTAFDIETSGLFPWAPDAYVSSIGIATAKHEYVFPLQHTGTSLYNLKRAQRMRVRRLARILSQTKVIAHNGKFDSLFLRVLFDVNIPIHFDTMLAHYNLDENTRHGLDYLSAVFLNASGYDVPLRIKHGLGDINDHALYLAKDIRYTFSLFELFRPQLEKDLMTKQLFEKLTMRFHELYQEIEFNGCYVRPDTLEETDKYWSSEKEKYAQKLKKWGDINWNSPPQIRQLLFDDLGIKPLDKTDGGDWSTSESVLLRIKHPIGRDILGWRGAEKQLNTFVSALDQRRDPRGFIHPNFLIHGTVTGRPSCKSPNLQQIPRDPRIRSIIDAPPQDDWVLVQFDISQAEMRIAAEMSKCPNLAAAFRQGKDVHVMIVQSNFGIANPTKDERKKGKAINFGYLFGMGAPKFQIYARDNYGIEVSMNEARASRKGYFETWSGLSKWHDRQRRFVKAKGYVRSLIGRKRRLPMVNSSNRFLSSEAERQAINSPVQSLATDWNGCAAYELKERTSRDHLRLCGTIHDATLCWVLRDQLRKIIPLALGIYCAPSIITNDFGLKMTIPMEAEASIGPWGSGVSPEEFFN